MLRQSVHELVISTRGRGFTDITSEVAAHVRQTGLQTGLGTLHLRHTSASLLSQENADRLAPDGDPLFRHTSEGDDDMPAHIRTALTTVNLSIPIAHGALVLGTWQGIYVWEHRTAGHRRELVLHLLGE